MLTIRQNFLETIRGGNPDRFVNQYEALGLVFGPDPLSVRHPFPTQGGPMTKTSWGVSYIFPEGMPGGMPVHREDLIVIQDIENWKDYVKMPQTDWPEAEWEVYAGIAEKVDKSQVFRTIMMAPGLFEMCHHLMSIDKALVYYLTNPDEMKDLIKYLTEYELKWSEQLLKYSKADALFHHDDWGSHISSFLSPDMFADFFLEPYKEIYKFHKDNGVEVIVHHSDSYAANLVPYMIEMGIDVFQGCVTTNDVPSLVKKYGGQISFMGDLNNGKLDVPNWTPELIRSEVERACRENGKHYFIPCLTMGGPGSSFPGVYDAVTSEIDRMSKEMFGTDVVREPPQILF